ncbi:MAG: 6-phosphofructokinase, partial [Chloroflexales bacterium]|nr:6-phosphofructokinase [Chloroflexales bacterium]
MRIGILTGGGDVPGLNPCIKAVVNGAEERGWEVLGIRRGWGGLLNYNTADDEHARAEWVRQLKRGDVRTIDRYGGTHLHTSRTNPQKVRPGDLPEFLKERFPFAPGAKTVDTTPHVLEVLEHLQIDTLVPIGGDDTLSYAVRMHQEGFRVVAIPKTMDND